MFKSLLVLLLLGLLAVGCNSNPNQAATPENPNAGQPSSNNPSTASNTSPNTANNPDQQFINEAAKGNRAEVELGKIVASNAKDPNVKKFAQMMIDDHTKALNELQQMAQSKNITLPDGIPEDAQDLKAKLTTETGKQMEKDYMDNMVQDHQKDVKDFEDASQSLKDNDIKQWATQTLPTLQQHLQRAQQIDSKLGGGKSQTGT